MGARDREPGRPAKEKITAVDSSVREAKRMIKEYRDAKLRILYFENVKRSLIRRAEICLDDYEEKGTICYSKKQLSCFPEKDKTMVIQYFQDKRTAFYIEKGVESIRDVRTKAIATQTLIEGRRCEDLEDAFCLKRRMMFIEKRQAVLWVAAFIEKYQEEVESTVYE